MNNIRLREENAWAFILKEKMMKTFSTMKTFKTVAATAMLAVLSLTACGDRPAEKKDGVAQNNAQTAVVSPLADGQGSAAQSGEMNAEDRGVAQNDDVTVIVSTLAGSGPTGIDNNGNFVDGGFADGEGSVARFNGLNGITIDAAGNLYVADGENHRIRKVTPEGVVSTLAGSEQGFADGRGSAARFEAPLGIAIDAAGNLYVVDMSNHRIRKITPNGEVSTLAGSGPTGEDNGGFADGQGSAARFNTPTGIAIDATGNLYVADMGNHRIRKVTPEGNVSTLAGSGPTGYDNGGFADGEGSAARFSFPRSIVIDATGNLYVVDTNNNRIRKITPNGEVSTLAGGADGNKPGFADGKGSAARFYIPDGIAIDAAGNLYVADTGNSRICKITPDGEVSTLAGGVTAAVGGERGFADGQGSAARFYFPSGITIDAAGNLYVTDSVNRRIRKIEFRRP